MNHSDEFLKDMNQGPVWRRLGDAERDQLIQKRNSEFNYMLDILPEVIYYEKGDESYNFHLELYNQYFVENLPQIKINCTVSPKKRKDESVIIYFGYSNARDTNESQFLSFLTDATNNVNQKIGISRCNKINFS